MNIDLLQLSVCVPNNVLNSTSDIPFYVLKTSCFTDPNYLAFADDEPASLTQGLLTMRDVPVPGLPA